MTNKRSKITIPTSISSRLEFKSKFSILEEISLKTESLTMFKKFAILSLLITTGLALSGCGNTLNGAGRDLESWGQTMQETF